MVAAAVTSGGLGLRLGRTKERHNQFNRRKAIAGGADRTLDEQQRAFLYMPYMHSESKLIQRQSLALYEALGVENNLRFARQHADIIDVDEVAKAAPESPNTMVSASSVMTASFATRLLCTRCVVVGWGFSLFTADCQPVRVAHKI